jgi:hypothetical protein
MYIALYLLHITQLKRLCIMTLRDAKVKRERYIYIHLRITEKNGKKDVEQRGIRTPADYSTRMLIVE